MPYRSSRFQRRSNSQFLVFKLHLKALAAIGLCLVSTSAFSQDLGKGHLKFGCSLGEMEDWVELINLP